MLAVAHQGLGVVDHPPPGAADQDVDPPVVRHDRLRPRPLQELLRRRVEQHGVAAGDALHQRVAEAGRGAEAGRAAGLAAGLVDQHRAPAVKARARAGEGGKARDAARQPLGVPDVVLVGEGVPVGADRGIAGEARDNSRRSPARALADLDPPGVRGREVRRGSPAVASVEPSSLAKSRQRRWLCAAIEASCSGRKRAPSRQPIRMAMLCASPACTPVVPPETPAARRSPGSAPQRFRQKPVAVHPRATPARLRRCGAAPSIAGGTQCR